MCALALPYNQPGVWLPPFPSSPIKPYPSLYSSPSTFPSHTYVHTWCHSFCFRTPSKVSARGGWESRSLRQPFTQLLRSRSSCKVCEKQIHTTNALNYFECNLHRNSKSVSDDHGQHTNGNPQGKMPVANNATDPGHIQPVLLAILIII